MYYTYIIESISRGSLYIGQTNNISDRINRHNTNQNKYTKNKGPWKLIFYKEFNTRSEAVKLELKLKSIKNKTFLLEKIK